MPSFLLQIFQSINNLCVVVPHLLLQSGNFKTDLVFVSVFVFEKATKDFLFLFESMGVVHVVSHGLQLPLSTTDLGCPLLLTLGVDSESHAPPEVHCLKPVMVM